jgi:hypothetical protein
MKKYNFGFRPNELPPDGADSTGGFRGSQTSPAAQLASLKMIHTLAATAFIRPNHFMPGYGIPAHRIPLRASGARSAAYSPAWILGVINPM